MVAENCHESYYYFWPMTENYSGGAEGGGE